MEAADGLRDKLPAGGIAWPAAEVALTMEPQTQ